MVHVRLRPSERCGCVCLFENIVLLQMEVDFLEKCFHVVFFLCFGKAARQLFQRRFSKAAALDAVGFFFEDGDGGGGWAVFGGKQVQGLVMEEQAFGQEGGGGILGVVELQPVVAVFEEDEAAAVAVDVVEPHGRMFGCFHIVIVWRRYFCVQPEGVFCRFFAFWVKGGKKVVYGADCGDIIKFDLTQFVRIKNAG